MFSTHSQPVHSKQYPSWATRAPLRISDSQTVVGDLQSINEEVKYTIVDAELQIVPLCHLYGQIQTDLAGV